VPERNCSHPAIVSNDRESRILQQLEAKADEATLIVFCHHGVRSLNVVHGLREQGCPPASERLAASGMTQ